MSRIVLNRFCKSLNLSSNMQNSNAIGHDPFAEERREYERTADNLFNELAESKRYSRVAMEELFNKLAESEQDRTASAERRLRAEEERGLAEEGRRFAEERRQAAEQQLQARIRRDHALDRIRASSGRHDSFDKEREDYLKTIAELYDQVLSLEQLKEEAEERRPIVERDYLVQLHKARQFEALYNEEKRKREAIEEELAKKAINKETLEEWLDWVICE